MKYYRIDARADIPETEAPSYMVCRSHLAHLWVPTAKRDYSSSLSRGPSSILGDTSCPVLSLALQTGNICSAITSHSSASPEATPPVPTGNRRAATGTHYKAQPDPEGGPRLQLLELCNVNGETLF